MPLSGMIVLDTQLAPPANSPSSLGVSDEVTPESVFAQLFNLFVAPARSVELPGRAAGVSHAGLEPAMTQPGAQAPTSESVDLDGAQLTQTDHESLSGSNLPPSQTVAQRSLAGTGKFAAMPNLEPKLTQTNQNVSPPARLHGIGNQESPAAVDFARVAMERRPGPSDEAGVDDLRETATAVTQSATVPAASFSYSLPTQSESPLDGELSAPVQQSGSPVTDDRTAHLASTVAEGFTPPLGDGQPKAEFSAPWAGTQLGGQREPTVVSDPATNSASSSPQLPSQPQSTQARQEPAVGDSASGWVEAIVLSRAAAVEVPTAVFRESRASVERQTLALLNDANTVATPEPQIESPASEDSSSANATASQKQPHGAHRFLVTEPPPEIKSDSSPLPLEKPVATMHPGDSNRGHHGIASLLNRDTHNPANGGSQGDARDNQHPLNLSVIVGAAPSPNEEPRGGEAAARPGVDQLARGIIDYLRAGRQAAVLHLEPPELGKVKIDLRMEDGQLHLRIAAEGDDSQRLIENHLPELHQALRVGQIEVADVRVTQGDGPGGSGLAQNSNQSAQGRQDARHGFAGSASRDESESGSPPPPRHSPDGRVSMWA